MNLSKVILLFSLICSFCQLRAQSTVEELMTNEFIPSYCECLEQNKDASPERLVTTISLKCGLKFAMDNFKRLQKTMDEKFPNMTKEEQFKAGRLLGGDIKVNAAARIVRECETYRLALVGFKENLMSRTSKKEVKKEVKRLKKTINSGSSKANTQTYLTIGLLCEKTGNFKDAMEAYENSDQLKPSAIVRGLKTLLEMRDK